MQSIDFSHYELSLNVIIQTLENWENKENINDIDFEGNLFNANKDIIHLFTNVLPQFSNIKTLNFSNTSLGMSEFLSILKYLSHCPNITSVNVTSNFIFYKTIPYQNVSELYNGQLQELVLDENDLGRRGIEMISSCFVKMKQLKKLSLKDCNIENMDFYQLGKNIHHLTNLVSLNISENCISFDGTTYLLQNIHKEHLSYLNMKMKKVTSGNDYSKNYNNHTMFHSIRQLKECRVLYWNILLNDFVFEAFCSLPKLNKIDLSFLLFYNYNNLNYVFKFSDSLESISLHKNSNSVIQILLHAIPNTIKILKIENIYLKPRIIHLLLEKIKKLPNLMELTLRRTYIGNNDFKQLCLNLFSSPQLQDLTMTTNHITDSGFHCFFANRHRWKQLKFISFYRNNISDKAIERILPRLNYYTDYPLKILLNREISKNFFEEKIIKMNIAKEKILATHLCKKEMKLILEQKKFIHRITAVTENRNIIRQYNNLVDESKKMVLGKKKYIHFLKWIDKNVHHTEYIFHQYDLGTFLYQYI
jgi:Ran GTPase-activating protein (RanGAP) involved in mRNA processing and transport